MGKRLAVVLVVASCAGGSGGAVDSGGGGGDGPLRDASTVDATYPSTLDGNRDRLLHTYLLWLQATPTTPQSNGLLGSNLHDMCGLWTALAPSAQDVFLTLTHRMDGATLDTDGTHMLDHVTRLYRVSGGQDATATSAGSCGGGEYNRMIMSMDAALQAAQLAASTRHGAQPYDLADIPSTSGWRDSHDAAGPHTPFTLSDETNAGAPRAQSQYFRDPTSTAASSPLGRLDLTTLVDPYALELDQDYDCLHNSNPACDYTLYGPGCLPEATAAGTAIYSVTYGDFGPTWKPTGC